MVLKTENIKSVNYLYNFIEYSPLGKGFVKGQKCQWDGSSSRSKAVLNNINSFDPGT